MSNRCPFCGADNRQGILFCEECGRSLYDKTSELTIPGRQNASKIIEQLAPREGRSHLEVGQGLMLYIRNAKEPVPLTTEHAMTIGRKGRGVNPDLDLTPYGAMEKGVSRIHATVQVVNHTPIITDMGSTNGLYLNGDLIPAQQSQILCDGDELHLGELVAHIYFE